MCYVEDGLAVGLGLPGYVADYGLFGGGVKG